MGYQKHQHLAAGLWALTGKQHGVVTRAQLLALGFSGQSIKHRVTKGRLHPVSRGVYAVGRPQLSRDGNWMAAVLSCGPHAALSHASAAELWGIHQDRAGLIHVSVPEGVTRRRAGVVIHRLFGLTGSGVTTRRGIPVTTPLWTLVDLAASLPRDDVEAAVNAADKRDLITPEALRAGVDRVPGRAGVATLRHMLDRRTFTLTDSRLERRFLPLVRKAGLPRPLTRRYVNGFRTDFHWPELGLVVETDGLRYHRTPAQQATDRMRDQTHTAAGLTTLRFTHGQVAFERDRVVAVLAAVGGRLTAR